MTNLSNILEALEKLVYDIILSILLVPKTLVRIIFEPSWVSGYITQQLKQEDEKRFDEYVSPILFMILVALLPYTYITVAHWPEVVIRGPAEGIVNQEIRFTAEANLTSKTPPYEYEWYTDDGGTKTHQSNRLTDEETFVWETSGKKLILLDVTNRKGETRKSYPLYVQIREAGENISSTLISSEEPKPNLSGSVFFSALQAPSTIMTMFYLLGLPILLTSATEINRGHVLSRTSLKRAFFIHCYLVSPFYLALWTASIGIDFYAIESEWYFTYFVAGGVLLMVFWLTVVETGFLGRERGINKWKALAMVLFCIFTIPAALLILDFGSIHPEVFRLSLWGLFITFIMGIFLYNIVQVFRGRRKKAVTKRDHN